ncbi:hypothetical protein ACFC37_01130 [Enterococcus durans]|uniref:hypothetical protein n=1 Tax=Enterococcus durans TaxID=53345 RepID=UPI00356B52F8
MNKKIKRIGDEINQIAKATNSISKPLPDSQIENLLELYDEFEKSVCEFFEMDPNAVRKSTPDLKGRCAVARFTIWEHIAKKIKNDHPVFSFLNWGSAPKPKNKVLRISLC